MSTGMLLNVNGSNCRRHSIMPALLK